MSGILNTTGSVSGILGKSVLPVGVTGGSGLTALGTVATANLSNNNIVMPRFKEFDSFHKTATVSTSTVNLSGVNDTGLDICSGHYITLTPEHVDDVFEFSYHMNARNSGGYFGLGLIRSTATDFSANWTLAWSGGEHSVGSRDSFSGDAGEYVFMNGNIRIVATGLTPDTPYYYKLIGTTHGIAGTYYWGVSGTNCPAIGIGVTMSGKRWSTV